MFDFFFLLFFSISVALCQVFLCRRSLARHQLQGVLPFVCSSVCVTQSRCHSLLSPRTATSVLALCALLLGASRKTQHTALRSCFTVVPLTKCQPAIGIARRKEHSLCCACACVRTSSYRLRGEGRWCSHGTSLRFRGCDVTSTWFVLVDIEDLPPTVQEKLFDEVLDRDVQKGTRDPLTPPPSCFQSSLAIVQ